MNTLIITKRELRQFFLSPMTYFVGAIFLFCTGLSFFFIVALHNSATFTWFFYNVAVILLFVVPPLTMRVFSAETHSGALEILLTTPVRPWEVVMGKFLAAFLLFVVWLVPTLIYLLLLTMFDDPHFPVIFSGYLGIVFLGAMLISVGVLTSALSTRKTVAVILTFIISLLFWLAGKIDVDLGGFIGRVFSYLSVQEHFTDFLAGLITANNIVYFLTVTIGLLFITTRILEARKGYQ